MNLISPTAILRSLVLALLPLAALAALAASRRVYLAASVSGWSNNPSFNRSVKTTRNILHGTNEFGYGRGKIIIVRPLLLAWRVSGDEKCLQQARDIVRACNKVMLDAYDTPQLNNASQVAFALSELAAVYKQFKQGGQLAAPDYERMTTMLKAAAGFWLRTRAQPGGRNLDQRYAPGVASVATIFSDDTRWPRWQAWAALSVEKNLNYPFGERPSAGGAPENGEQSNWYETATLLGWICLGEALGRGAELRTRAVWGCD